MNDTELIERARQLDNEDWNGASLASKEAQSKEARQELERIARSYYWNEEYSNGDN